MPRTAVIALSVIALALSVLAGVVVLWVTGRLQGSDAARDAALEHAEREARYYCTLSGVVPGMTGLDDPAYLNCVKRETDDRMLVWDHTKR